MKSKLHPEIETIRVTDKQTMLLYDAQLFDDGALVRQVGTGMIEMWDLENFWENFEESYVAR